MYGLTTSAYETFVVAVLFTVLATTCVILRFFLRVKKTSLGVDDWLLIPAMVGYYAYIALVFWGLCPDAFRARCKG